MRVVIRTDASTAIGSGHVMRCLALAEALRSRGAEVSFICREHPGNLNGLLEAKGFDVARLEGTTGICQGCRVDGDYASWLGVSWEEDCAATIAALGTAHSDCLVVDHYSLDHRWEKRLRPHVGRIAVIDDLADRRHECDLLLDQNLYDDFESRYDGLVPAGCRKFLGPAHALLRHEFVEARRSLRQRYGNVRRILVFFGAADPTNETANALLAFQSLNRPDIKLDVVVGSANPRKGELEEICRKIANTSYHVQVDNMAELMAAADLAIGAGGGTTWERCCLELPSITVVIADNQRDTTVAVAAAGGTLLVGRGGEVTADVLARAIMRFVSDVAATKEMGRLAGEIMGGRTVAASSCLIEAILEGQIAAS